MECTSSPATNLIRNLIGSAGLDVVSFLDLIPMHIIRAGVGFGSGTESELDFVMVNMWKLFILYLMNRTSQTSCSPTAHERNILLEDRQGAAIKCPNTFEPAIDHVTLCT